MSSENCALTIKWLSELALKCSDHGISAAEYAAALHINMLCLAREAGYNRDEYLEQLGRQWDKYHESF